MSKGALRDFQVEGDAARQIFLEHSLLENNFHFPHNVQQQHKKNIYLFLMFSAACPVLSLSGKVSGMIAGENALDGQKKTFLLCRANCAQ